MEKTQIISMGFGVLLVLFLFLGIHRNDCYYYFKDIEFFPTLVEYVVTIISAFVFTILFIYSFEREYE